MKLPIFPALIFAGLIASGVAPVSAQAPAPARPPATATPLPAPPTAEALDQLVQVALDAFNSGEFAKFFTVYDGSDSGKRDAKAFTDVMGEHGKKFGRYEKRTLKREWTYLTGDAPRVAYVASFQKLPKANLAFVFKRTPLGFRIQEISILDASVNN